MLRTPHHTSEQHESSNPVSTTTFEISPGIIEKAKSMAGTAAQRMFRASMYAVPVINASTDAGRAKRGFTGYPDALAYSSSAIAFLTSLTLGKRTIQNFDSAYHVMHDRQTPKEWPTLSANKMKLALSIAIASTIYIAISDSIRSYNYANRMPDDYQFADHINTNLWIILAVSFAAMTGIGALFNNGYNHHKLLHAMFSDEEVTYTNKYSRIASPIIGYVAGPFGMMNDVITNFTVYNSIGQTAISPYVVAGTTVPVSVLYYSFNSRFIRDSINKLIHHTPNHFHRPKKIVSFALAMTISGVLAYSLGGLNEILYNNAMKSFNIETNDTYDAIAKTLSWGGATNRLILLTANLDIRFIRIFHEKPV